MKHKDLVIAAENLSNYLNDRLSQYGESLGGFKTRILDRPTGVKAFIEYEWFLIVYVANHLRVRLSVGTLGRKYGKEIEQSLTGDDILLKLVQNYLIQLVKASPNKKLITSNYYKDINKITFRGRS